MSNKRETRVARLPVSQIEVRKQADGTRTVEGYCTVFSPARSQDLGGFTETISASAFDEYLSTNPDIMFLFGHDTNRVLARTKSGTLTVTKDSKGLKIRASLPNTTDGNDLAESLSRGDIDAMSFGFYCSQDSWEQLKDGTLLRTVLKAEIFEASAVSSPAYTQTTLGLRSVPQQYRHLLKRDAGDATEINDDSGCTDEDKQDPSSDCYDPDFSPDNETDFTVCGECRSKLCTRCSANFRTAVDSQGLPMRGGLCVRCVRSLCDSCVDAYDEYIGNGNDVDADDERNRRLAALMLRLSY